MTEPMSEPPAADHAELVEVLSAVTAEVGERPRPDTALRAACAAVRAGVGAGTEPLAGTAATAGLEPGRLPEADEDLWLSLARTTVSPAGADPDEVGVTAWLCTMAALTLWGPGTQANPPALATYIVESEGGDAALLEAAFRPVVERRRALGALDATERLTPLGWWGLPEAQLRAWSAGT